MKNSILTGILIMFGMFLASCANNMHGTTDTTTTCTVSNGQLVSSNGTACSGNQAVCTQQGLAYNSLTGQCVSGTGVGTGYGGTGIGGTGYGGTTISTPSCDYWNQVYAGYGYYVPMQVQGQYYCVNIQQYVPNYQNYYQGGAVYGQSCQYSNCGGQYYSGGDTCFGIGAGAGSSYGISGYFSICL